MKNNEVTVYTIADFFLSKSSLTPKKIQKLVYYAYAWFIALNNDSSEDINNVLFAERPEAWIHGPVFPSLYSKFKSFNWNEVPQIKEKITFESKDLNGFLDDVWEIFGKYTADELEYMTHQDLPWKNARINCDANEPCNNKISFKDIFIYYNGI